MTSFLLHLFLSHRCRQLFHRLLTTHVYEVTMGLVVNFLVSLSAAAPGTRALHTASSTARPDDLPSVISAAKNKVAVKFKQPGNVLSSYFQGFFSATLKENSWQRTVITALTLCCHSLPFPCFPQHLYGGNYTRPEQTFTSVVWGTANNVSAVSKKIE